MFCSHPNGLQNPLSRATILLVLSMLQAQVSQNSSQETVLQHFTKLEHQAVALQNTLLHGITRRFISLTRSALKVCSS